jgi:TPP-dependent 2-oxoacid decarboxylase
MENLVEAETKFTRSMRLLDSIKRGEGIIAERKNIRLIDNLMKNGLIIRRPGRMNWASDSYDLTIKAEKTLDDYDKMGEVIGGSRPSTGHRGL